MVARGLKFGVLLMTVILIFSLVVSRFAGAAISHRAAGLGNNAGGATTLNVSKPSGTQDGDILIAVISVRGGTSTTITPPAGWTLINSNDSTTILKSSIFWKQSSASDNNIQTFSFNSSQKASGIISGYSGVDTTSPVNAQNSQVNASSTSMTAPDVTTTVTNTMVIAAYSTATGTTMTAGSSMSLRGQAASTGGSAATRTTSGLQDIIQSATGSTGTKTMTAGTAAVNIGHTIALKPAASVSQVGYRFFDNTDSTSVTTAMAAKDTAVSVSSGVPFRLRINLGVSSSEGSALAGLTYKLQYALRGADNSCDTSFTSESYADVLTSATPVRFYNNVTPSNGAAYLTNASDPTRSGVTAVGQTYNEDNPISVTTSTPAGQDMLWDIALMTSGVSAGEHYCLRVVKESTGATLNGGYSVIPEVAIVAATVTQANYRWYSNADSTTPGSVLAAQDTAAYSVAAGTPIRLRQRLAVDTASLGINQDFKLQYAERSGICDTSFSGEMFYDVNNPGGENQSVTANSTIVSENTSYGTFSWTSPQNAAGEDSTYAQLAGATTGSYYLQSSQHGFNIRPDATISGIELKVRVYYEGYDASDSNVRLAKAGIPVGTNHATSASFSYMSPAYYTYGSPTDLWGTTWTPSEINDTNFGGMFSGWTSDSVPVGTLYVDNMQIVVYYTVPDIIKFYDNVTPTNAASISSIGSDPTNGVRGTIYQSYQEVNLFSASTVVAAGSDGLWDFALATDSSVAGKTYCLRMVKSDGGLLDTYTNIPEISFASAGGPTLDQKTRGGQAVVDGVKSPYSF